MNANATLNSSDSLVLRSQLEIKESEEMSRYLDKRVREIENSFNSLSTEFRGYARRTAKLRNNGDKIIEILNEYVCRQLLNSSTNGCIKKYCNIMSIIEDIRNLEVSRIKDHIIVPMLDYNDSLKKIKVEIKKDMNARKKELTSYKKLSKSLTGSGTSEAKARGSTQMAVINATVQSERLMNTVTDFEKRKLEHVQSLLRSFVHIEMLWHMRALERYSDAYEPLKNIDCNGDLNEFMQDLTHFRSQDHLIKSNSNLHLNSRWSQSMDNLKSTNPSGTVDGQYQRSRSFQTAVRGRSQTDLTTTKPPVAASPRTTHRRHSPGSESEETDPGDYTDDGTTAASRTTSAKSTNRSGTAPQPHKRGR